ncbi:hypothetical protein LCGC14_2195820 [marine sediment metagenome]|uniref:Uncharacterized protein n=1 Tax=marine sediment metagenome TaxID=412755 RepID=A0A0F9DIC4_9ZZZZ
MAEANYHGKFSLAYWKPSGGAFALIVNQVEWNFAGVAGTAESSVKHLTQHGKTRLLGFKGATATVTCHLPGDKAIDEGDVGSLELLRIATNAGGGYSLGTVGTDGAICTGVELGVDKEGTESIVYTFTAKGAVINTVTQGT